MAISSLVVDIADDDSGEATLAALAADGRFTLGPAAGTRHAIVLDTPSALDDIEAFNWLQDLPGVRWTTVVKAYLDDETVPAGVAAAHL